MLASANATSQGVHQFAPRPLATQLLLIKGRLQCLDAREQFVVLTAMGVELAAFLPPVDSAIGDAADVRDVRLTQLKLRAKRFEQCAYITPLGVGELGRGRIGESYSATGADDDRA